MRRKMYLYQTHLFIFECSINRYVQIQVTSALSLQNSNGQQKQDSYLKIYKLTTNNKHALFFFCPFRQHYHVLGQYIN